MKVTTIFACLFLMFGILFAQAQKKSEKYLNKATIAVEEQNNARKYFKFEDESRPSVNEFISEYRSAFSLSNDNDLRVFRQETDELGQTHYRYKQYYNGLELFDTQFLVHEEDGAVKSANGEIMHNLNVETVPGLSEAQALRAALAHIGAEKYMWQSPSEEKMLKKVTDNKNSTYYPKGILGIAAEGGLLQADKFRLVYRFDVFAAQPMSRDYVDVDAITGKVINTRTRIHTGTVAGSGESLYNGNVKMKVADQNYPETPELPTYFHVESGVWVMSDPALGGYADDWYQVLDSDPIALSGSNLELSFMQRYSVEFPSPFPPYDGWDGMNVRISTDGGATWQVLANPVPAYTNASLYSFGNRHGEGPGIPGWTGLQNTFVPVTVDLSAYAGQTVQIRFAFASDEAFSTVDDPTLFGWEIDDILVTNAAGTLFSNDGSAAGMTPGNLVIEVNIIAGDFRLREDIRGDGVFTYNMQNSFLYTDAVDFVSDSKDSWPSATGVQAHWATEETYDYFKTRHNRDSFDDNGGRIISYVSARTNFNNAFWNGEFMTYGDGDGTNFGPLISLDVVGHEITHGVTEHSADLIYQGESGALNESFSDIFGNLVEFFAEEDEHEIWGVGEDFDLSGAGGFRSMSDPNSKGDPDTYYGNFWRGTTAIDPDNGGVHSNSGVQNYWFYLLAEGGEGTNDNGDDYDIEDIGRKKAARIAYRNLTYYLTPSSAYFAARNGAIESARDLYGEDEDEDEDEDDIVETVKAAWDAVGVYELQPLFNIDNLVVYVEGLSLLPADETLLVGLLTNARGFLEVGDLNSALTEITTFRSTAISLFFSGDISFVDVFYLIDESDKFFEMYAINPPPMDDIDDDDDDDDKDDDIQTLLTLPTEFGMGQNYPNPFNPETQINFALPEQADVTLRVFNVRGQLIRTLVNGSKAAGFHTVTWNAKDANGIAVPSGAYFLRINAGEKFVKTNKMMLIK